MKSLPKSWLWIYPRAHCNPYSPLLAEQLLICCNFKSALKIGFNENRIECYILFRYHSCRFGASLLSVNIIILKFKTLKSLIRNFSVTCVFNIYDIHLWVPTILDPFHLNWSSERSNLFFSRTNKRTTGCFTKGVATWCFDPQKPDSRMFDRAWLAGVLRCTEVITLACSL